MRSLIIFLALFAVSCNKTGFAPQFGSLHDYLFLGTFGLCPYSIDEGSGRITSMGSFPSVFGGAGLNGLVADNQRNLLVGFDTVKIYLLSFDPNSGAVATLSSISLVATNVVLSTNAGLAFVSSASNLHIYNYAGGTLSEVYGSPFLGGGNNYALVDPLQKFLFQFSATTEYVMNFTSSGVPSAPVTGPIAGGAGGCRYCNTFAFNSMGGYLFAGNGNNTISTYTVSTTGTLSAGPTYTPPGGQSGLFTDKVDRILLNFDTITPTVTAYRINNRGASLTFLNNSGLTLPTDSVASMDLSPTGQYFYYYDNSGGFFDAYSIDSSGNFTFLYTFTAPAYCLGGLVKSHQFYK